MAACSDNPVYLRLHTIKVYRAVKMWWSQSTRPVLTSPYGAFPVTAPPTTHLFPVHSHPTLWRPEYASYMIEGTPGQPYGGTMSEFNTVEGNMAKRRREASSVLDHNQTLCTITSFPRYFTPSLLHCSAHIHFHFLLYLKIIYNSKWSCFGWRCRLGCPGFTKPEYRPSPVDSGVAKSLFFPDEAINKHPRFR